MNLPGVSSESEVTMTPGTALNISGETRGDGKTFIYPFSVSL